MSMPTLRRMLSGVLISALAVPALAAQTPTLAELARREQERRKAIKSSEKVLTNKDLPPSARQPAPATSADSPAGAPPAGQPDQKTSEPRKDDASKGDATKDEAWWRERITKARDGLRRSEVFLEALQTRVNSLTADFVNRDDPFQRAKVGEDRQKALAEMERVRAEIELFKKQIEEIEEDARKAGVPAGWLR